MIRNWVVLDLDVFRRYVDDPMVRREYQDNKDGTFFIAYDIRSFPPELLAAASPTMQLALEKGVDAVERPRGQAAQFDDRWRQRIERVRQPDLQDWIQRFGGYTNIPWDEWDRANAEWQTLRRDMTVWP
jgi:hypothetical protein